jgi:hypothetical protein
VGESATAPCPMNAAHVHLMLNHISILGSLFGLVLLTVAMIRHSRELVTVSFACLASVAIISIPVYFTGRPAEAVIRHLPGFSEEVVEGHEAAAQFAFTGIECVGVLALAGLWLFRSEPPPRWFLMVLLVGSLLTVVTMIETADRGRQIRHPELALLSRHRMSFTMRPIARAALRAHRCHSSEELTRSMAASPKSAAHTPLMRPRARRRAGCDRLGSRKV